MSTRFRLNKAALLTLAVATGVVLSSPVFAKMYKWTDENGKVHYTDSASKIPRKFRQQGEGSVETLQSAPTNSGVAGGGSSYSAYGGGSALPSQGIEVPLLSSGGGNHVVEVNLNGGTKALMMVDTGASMVILHPSMAQDVGVRNLDEQPRMPFSTAGGQEWSPIAVLDTVKVGHAVVRDVEVAFNSHMNPGGGLLGMTFLGEFRMEIDRNKKVMLLRPLNPGNDTVYGDRPGYWWKDKFKEYVSGLNRAYYTGSKSTDRLTKVESRKLALYYQDLVDRLTRRADAANLPQEYRIPFKFE